MSSEASDRGRGLATVASFRKTARLLGLGRLRARAQASLHASPRWTAVPPQRLKDLDHRRGPAANAIALTSTMARIPVSRLRFYGNWRRTRRTRPSSCAASPRSGTRTSSDPLSPPATALAVTPGIIATRCSADCPTANGVSK